MTKTQKYFRRSSAVKTHVSNYLRLTGPAALRDYFAFVILANACRLLALFFWDRLGKGELFVPSK